MILQDPARNQQEIVMVQMKGHVGFGIKWILLLIYLIVCGCIIIATYNAQKTYAYRQEDYRITDYRFVDTDAGQQLEVFVENLNGQEQTVEFYVNDQLMGGLDSKQYLLPPYETIKITIPVSKWYAKNTITLKVLGVERQTVVMEIPEV